MRYFLCTFSLCLILSCQSKKKVVNVHQEGRVGRTYQYKIYIDNKELVSDSIRFSTTVPNFNSHPFEEKSGVLKITVATFYSLIPIDEKVDYYSFFILTDTTEGVMKIKIVNKTHEKRPTFY